MSMNESDTSLTLDGVVRCCRGTRLADRVHRLADPEDARLKAAMFAAIERIRPNPVVAAQVAAQVNRKK